MELKNIIILLIIFFIIFKINREYFSNDKINVENMVTIGIKTFSRPKALNETLNNLVNNNDFKFNILIADDSLDKYKKENKTIVNKYLKKNKNIKILDMKFDSGISQGRNLIVDKCKTKYLIIMDDSRYFTRDLPVLKMIKFLETTKYDLLFGIIKTRGDILGKYNVHYSGIFDEIKKENNIIKIFMKKAKKIKNNLFNDVYETNIGLNVFIATTDSLKKVRWNDELKVGEHEIFFYNYYKNGYKCALTYDANFKGVKNENRIYGKDVSIKKYRGRAWNDKKYKIENRIKLFFKK
jgi:hypothetical protein